MVACGPSLGSRDGIGRTPLHLAIRFGAEPAVVAVLLEYGADIEARDDFHNTPLHAAIEGGNPDTVLLLIEHGADIEARDDIGANPLHRAVAKIIGTIAASLEQGTFTEGFDWVGDTALLAAIDARNSARSSPSFLHTAPIPRPGTTWGITRCWRQLGSGEPATVKILLEHGVFVEAKDKYGDPALHMAAGDAKHARGRDSSGLRRGHRGEGRIRQDPAGSGGTCEAIEATMSGSAGPRRRGRRSLLERADPAATD